MTDESLILDIDIIEKKHEEELLEKDNKISELAAEIEELKSRLKALEQKQ